MARKKQKLSPIVIAAGVGILGLVYVGQLVLNQPVVEVADSVTNPAPAGLVIPELNAIETKGKTAFEANCQKCHGENALGTNHGPTFLHPYYVPGHHADEAFYRAAANGVPSHHWNFGNMPKIEGVTNDDIATIVAYVRALQRANGIQ